MRWRIFLQPSKDNVDSYVVVNRPKNQDESIMLKIADCDRRVQLWFPWNTKDQIATSRKKVAGDRKSGV